MGVLDRTPLLRFLAPSALARHVAPCRQMPSADDPASALTRRRRLLRHSHAASSQHHAPTHRRRLVRPCGFSLRVKWPGRFCRARINAARLLAGTCSARFAARPLHRPRRARPRVMRRPLFRSRRSATHRRESWPGRSPFGGEAFLGFRPVNRPTARVGRLDHACDGVAFDAFGRRRSWGSDPFAGLIPPTGGPRVSAGPDPPAVRRPVGRGVLAARSAGPVGNRGRLDLPVERGASTAATREANERRRKGRSIEDRSVRLLGLSCSRLRSARVGVRLFRRRAHPALGFRLSQV
jgi:hypothetical protein